MKKTRELYRRWCEEDHEFNTDAMAGAEKAIEGFYHTLLLAADEGLADEFDAVAQLVADAFERRGFAAGVFAERCWNGRRERSRG